MALVAPARSRASAPRHDANEVRDPDEAVAVVYVLGALVVGGAERQLLLLLENLDRVRFAPHVIAFESGAWERHFRAWAASVDVIGFEAGRVRALLRCWRRLRRLRPTIVHTVGRTANYIGRVAAIAAGVPVIVTSERSAAFIRSPLMVRLDRLLARFTAHVISNSHHAATFLRERAIAPRDRLSVIPNGIEAGRYGPLATAHPGVVMGNVGDLRPEKNQIDLLRAVATIAGGIPEITLRIAGDGPLRKQLEAVAVELDVARRVTLTGWVEDISKFLGDIDIYVHSSRYEGLPNALMEAMARGLPCVAYDTTGCGELIEHMKTGLLVEPGDVAALSNAVVRLVCNPDLAKTLGSAARSFIADGFPVRAMVEKTCEVYERSLRGCGR
jgi:glycosyltransferase involved in cell wall biosynthesis